MYELPMMFGVIPTLTVEATSLVSNLTVVGAVSLAVSGVLFVVVALLGDGGNEPKNETRNETDDIDVRRAA